MENLQVTPLTEINPNTRIEKDFLGSVTLSNDVYYGIQTHRAYNNLKTTRH